MKWDATRKSPQPLLEVQRPGPCLELDLGREGGLELMPWGLTYIEGSLCNRLCSECCGCIISLNPDDITLWFLRHLCFTQGRTQQLPDLVKNQSLVRITPDQEAENSYLGCDSADRLASKQNQYKSVLSHFSRVWLFAIPWTVAHQALLSKEFSMQKYWSGSPCPPLGDLPNPRIEPTWDCNLRSKLKSEGYLLAEFLLAWGKVSLFLLSPLVDWMGPTPIMEGNLLHSMVPDLGMTFFWKAPSQQHLD